MEVVLLISLGLFGGYMLVVRCLFGVPPSISDSFYLWKERWNAGLVFTLWCFGVALSVMPLVLELSGDEWFAFLGFLMGFGLGLVGAAPLFKTREKGVHFLAAGISAVTAALWVLLMGYGYGLATLLLLGACMALMDRKWLFWLELSLFLAVYLVLIAMIL